MEIVYVAERPNIKLADIELIEGLKNPENARQLKDFQFEFYHRYMPYLFKIAINKLSSYSGAEALAEELVQDTMQLALEKIAAFTFADKVDSETAPFLIKGWLGKMGNNVYLRIIQKEKRHFHQELVEKDEDSSKYSTIHEVDDEHLDDGPVSEEIMKIRAVLNHLTPKQYDVLLTYASENCISTGNHLSDQAMNYLCSKHESNPENIRQIKKRSLDRLKVLLSI